MQNSEKMNGELYAFEQEFHKGIAACVGVEPAVVYQIIFDLVNHSMFLGVPPVDNHWWADSDEVKRIAPYLSEESIKESLDDLVEQGYLIQRNTLFSLGDAERI